jgi:tetratricopeptide (TPR) repeat protein
MNQNNLGNALLRSGERESVTGRQEEAVTAYREALKERTREQVPLQWAQTQNNIGNALWKLGEREGGPGRLEEAKTATALALGVYREAEMSRDVTSCETRLESIDDLIVTRCPGS